MLASVLCYVYLLGFVAPCLHSVCCKVLVSHVVCVELFDCCVDGERTGRGGARGGRGGAGGMKGGAKVTQTETHTYTYILPSVVLFLASRSAICPNLSSLCSQYSLNLSHFFVSLSLPLSLSL